MEFTPDTGRLTRFEKAKAIGVRAQMLCNNALPTVDTEGVLMDPRDVAKRELNDGVMPFVIVRKYPDGTVLKVPLTTK